MQSRQDFTWLHWASERFDAHTDQAVHAVQQHFLDEGGCWSDLVKRCCNVQERVEQLVPSHFLRGKQVSHLKSALLTKTRPHPEARSRAHGRGCAEAAGRSAAPSGDAAASAAIHKLRAAATWSGWLPCLYERREGKLGKLLERQLAKVAAAGPTRQPDVAQAQSKLFSNVLSSTQA